MDASRPQTQMYAQQQQPLMATQMVYQAPYQVNKVVSSTAWKNVKIALGSMIITIDIIIFGLGGGSLAVDAYYMGIVDMATAYPVAGIGIVWQIAEFITLCAHPDRGIHPGAHVGMQLILWLGAAICGGFLAAFAALQEAYGSYYSYSSRYRPSRANYELAQRLETSLAVFMIILFVLHFIYFVRACIECHRRNTMKPTIMMAAPPPQPYYPINNMGQMPPQQALYPVQYNPHTSMMSHQPSNPHMSMAPVPAPQQTARDSSAFGYYAPPANGAHETAANGEYKPDIAHTGSPAPVSTVSGDHGSSHHGHTTTRND